MPGSAGRWHLRQVLEVLIVDDDDALRQALAELLAGASWIHVVGVAGSVSEALSEAQRLRPGVVLMDVSLPDGDGFHATQQILAELPGTEVVILTLHSGPGYERRARAVGARGFVDKARLSSDL